MEVSRLQRRPDRPQVSAPAPPPGRFPRHDTLLPSVSAIAHRYNDWTPCIEEGLRSCKIDPTSRPAKRSLAGDMSAESDGNGSGQLVPAGVKFVKRIEVNDEDGYHVLKRPGALVVLQFEGAGSTQVVEA